MRLCAGSCPQRTTEDLELNFSALAATEEDRQYLGRGRGTSLRSLKKQRSLGTRDQSRCNADSATVESDRSQHLRLLGNLVRAQLAFLLRRERAAPEVLCPAQETPAFNLHRAAVLTRPGLAAPANANISHLQALPAEIRTISPRHARRVIPL